MSKRDKLGKPVPSRGSKPGEKRGAAGKGRLPGTLNKATANAREAIAAFVDDNSPRLQGWLDQIAVEQGAAAAFRCVQDLLEYHVPKLARTELNGPNGGPIQVENRTLIIDGVDSK